MLADWQAARLPRFAPAFVLLMPLTTSGRCGFVSVASFKFEIGETTLVGLCVGSATPRGSSSTTHLHIVKG